MKTIIKIIGKEGLISKKGKAYYRTHALLEDGTEAVGYGPDFEINDKVEVFYHYETVKMRKPQTA